MENISIPLELIQKLRHSNDDNSLIKELKTLILQRDENKQRDSTDLNKNCDILEFFHNCYKLKKLKRTGWIRNGIKDPESVADHMHRMGIMSLVSSDDQLDKNKYKIN